ncbi:MAG: GDP-mannose 4,6-dehydratase [Rhodospirillales bacterium]|nr:GDP-mannose 4,6-dehydratase [Rhodospirillales bacterium]
MAGQKTALITGVTGQDGAIMARFLLGQGYIVHGLRLYSATDDSQRFNELMAHPAFHFHHGDLTDGGNLWRLLAAIQPDEIYNLAAQSHVQVSFTVPEATAEINALGVTRLLEAIRGLARPVKFYQASSSEMFGNAPGPQSEKTPMSPCSPYGAAKRYAYDMVRIYRQAYGLFACNGILFNHESPLRGEEFVTRKITRAVAAIEAGQQDVLTLGNLEAQRDWGHARDYMEGVWLMMQQDISDDYVLATGTARRVRDFVEAAFGCTGVALDWRGEGVGERGYDLHSGRLLVSVDPQFFRPNELCALIGDASKAREVLGWRPRTAFDGLVREMVDYDRVILREQGGDEIYIRAAE